MKILFVKLGALGDVINTLPLAVNLKERLGAEIIWLVEPLSFPIVSGHPSVDRVILFNKKEWKISVFNVLHEIRSEGFDIALDLQRILKSACFCMASRASRRIGFDRDRCKESTWIFPFERIAPSDSRAHMAVQYLDFARHLGVSEPEIRWDIPVMGKIQEGLPEKYVVLNIGATKKANKWPDEGFSKLSNMISERFGMSSVITGGAEDVDASVRITKASSPGSINMAGKTTISELKEIIARAEMVVSCDTGPMHLAVALGRPVIALFGPSDPRRTGPLYGEVIQKNLDCVPCNKRECENPRCMREITPTDVLMRMEAVWSA